MRFDPSRLLACAVSAGLAASPLAVAPADYLMVSVCARHATAVRIPIPGKPARPDCPAGCHAVMTRKCDAHEDSD